ncbi:GNAT family N-acetyltransferase [Tichowtungia aerotolerans]|uniref:GNAT family N-acetyltransferase n=1 Tax=Tichowtungia aerotolerans TaxID=2697043 RepID=A0A6P1MA61_9BACT|nr:N-acetyltransferase [Tichowtungia aerotolerans]QHI68978.1 GNAT family N-acetyltransferase [Tichowtungia aerotolerans]
MGDAIEINVRIATIDDLSAIFHLGERVFTSQGFSNLYRTWDEYEVTHLFNSETEHVLVAETDDETVVGFAMGTVIDKARSAWSYGHLLWLGVEPKCARQGIAGQLFDRFREIMDAEGVRMLMVDTQADNDPAIRFFTQKGFENPTEHVYLTLNLDKEG